MIPRNLLYSIHEEHQSAGHGEKQSVITRYANQLGITENRLYGILKKEFGGQVHTGKKRGAKSKISELLIDAIQDIKAGGFIAGPQSTEPATHLCLKYLAELGFPDAQSASTAQVNRRLREKGFRVKRRFERLEADYPLQVVHADYTRSRWFQIQKYDSQRQDYILKAQPEGLAYKENNKTLRSWLFVTKDAYSRLVRCKMMAATGESALLALECFGEFWQESHTPNPFNHPPENLWMDRGATAKAEYFKNAMQSVGINLVELQTKEAQGKVEREMNTLKNMFEAMLYLKMGNGSTLYMSEYNALVEEFFADRAEERHPVLSMSKATAYRKGLLQHPPKQIETNLFHLAFNVKIRVVDVYGTVRWDNQLYALPQEAEGHWITQGTKVRLYKNLHGDVMADLVEFALQKPVILEPYKASGYNFEQRHKDTPQQKTLKAAKKTVKKPIHEKLPEFTPETTQVPKIAQNSKIKPLPPRQVPAEIQGAFAGSSLPSAEYCKTYINMCLQPYGLRYIDVAHAFENQIGKLTRKDLDELLNEFLSTQTQSKTA